MHSPIVKRCTKVAGGAVKTLKLPDGRYENRTYVGDWDTAGQPAGTYSSLAEAWQAHDADVRTFNEVPPAS